MIDNKAVEKIIEERKKMHPDDPRIVEKWRELTKYFVQDQETTIEYLNNCNKENLKWIGEIFDDISELLQSYQFIECIERLSIKYPDLNLESDVFYARKVFKNNNL